MKVWGSLPENITDPKAMPVIHGCRKIPLVDKLRDTLDDLLQADVIAQVTEPTPWVNSLVITEKKDKKKLRVCLDPTDLNKAILRQHPQQMMFCASLLVRRYSQCWMRRTATGK